MILHGIAQWASFRRVSDKKNNVGAGLSMLIRTRLRFLLRKDTLCSLASNKAGKSIHQIVKSGLQIALKEVVGISLLILDAGMKARKIWNATDQITCSDMARCKLHHIMNTTDTPISRLLQEQRKTFCRLLTGLSSKCLSLCQVFDSRCRNRKAAKTCFA
jgi:hypothetical protein